MKPLKLPNLTILTLNEPNLVDFSEARNRLLSSAQTDWVLFIDQDEVITPALAHEIKTVLGSRKANYVSAFRLKRQDRFLGRVLKYGETGNASFIRLAKSDWGRWRGAVHETWEGRGPTPTLHTPLLHSPHPTLSSFVAKLDHYSTLAAAERYAQHRHPSLLSLISYPFAKFVLNYFVKLGFLDGVPGLIHALMMSWHSYLTHAKLYLLWQKR